MTAQEPPAARGDDMNRRSFLRHAAWAGAAVTVAVTGGLVTTEVVRGSSHHSSMPSTDFTFVQISDSHIGFKGAANHDVTATFSEALKQVNALPDRPDFVIHTGDLTHFSTNGQFDQVKQMLGGLRTGQVLTLPGEHDSTDDTGQKYLRNFGAGTHGDGWFSFDHKGVHFIALVNTINLQKSGHLGTDQIDFVKRDVARLANDTPIVVFSHIPLFEMYTPWGWATDDAPQALSHLSRFASVTCLNGHVHQIMNKVEGKVSFHTAAPMAYPLPLPGHGPAPQPVVLPPSHLHQALGVRDVQYVARQQELDVHNERLA